MKQILMQLESQLFTYCFRSPIRDVEELCLRLVETWTEFQQSIVCEATEERRKRVCLRWRKWTSLGTLAVTLATGLDQQWH